MSAPRNWIDDPLDVDAVRAKLDSAIKPLRAAAERFAKNADWRTTSLRSEFWRCQIHGDVLEQFQTLLQGPVANFESMLILAVSRYVFEGLAWLKLTQKDSRYTLVFYRELLETQIDYWTRFATQAGREIGLLNEWDAKEKLLMERRMKELNEINDPAKKIEAAAKLAPAVMREIDEEAARAFSMFAGQARINGYGFQAYLVGEKVLAPAQASMRQLQEDAAAFDSDAPPDVRELWRRSKRGRSWNWRQAAENAGLLDDHDFIYSYTSRMLHATPASITTAFRTLQADEVMMFQRYIRVRVTDALELANDVIATSSAPN